MRVLVMGAGRMGAQIACELAIGGHDVAVLARDATRADASLTEAFEVARRHDLAPAGRLERAHETIDVTTELAAVSADTEHVLESIVEDMAAKAAVLAPVARALPQATIATNTSSLSIDALGAAIQAPDRTLGTHYLNPPLLMPPVEVVRGERTDDRRVQDTRRLLEELGKRPVVVERDVPGFVWNRLQFALLREALWLLEDGVATPETIDVVVKDGLARRWRQTGPFETMALGGPRTFAAVAANLFPELSTATTAEGLDDIRERDPAEMAALARRRDRELAADLRRDRDSGRA